jgi:hypothetical protein
MPKKSLKKSKSFSTKLRDMGRANLAVVAAFVLVFVGLGTWFVARSEAYTPCVYQGFAQGNAGTCVKAIQSIIDGARIGAPILKTCPNGEKLSYYCSGGYYDGIYGPRTTTGVYDFQRFARQAGWPNLTVDGRVGSATWHPLCAYAGHNDRLRAGCSAIGIYPQ